MCLTNNLLLFFSKIHRRTVDYTIIEKYGQYLKTKGVQAVFVNGTTGEGTTLTVEERKRLAEEWLRVARKHGMHMVLSVGGIDITDVYELAEHAEKIGVDAIVLLPDLFYKPRTEEDLVDYLKDIFKYAPTRPFYYYHIPEHTNVYRKFDMFTSTSSIDQIILRFFSFGNIQFSHILFFILGILVNLVRLTELLQRAYPNYSGVYYRHTNIELANTLLKEGHNVILSTDTILSGVLTLGFETISAITLNIYPEHVIEIYDNILNSKYREAREKDDKLYRQIKDIVAHKTQGWVELMKYEFNKKVDFKLGETRRPRTTYNYYMK